MSSDGSEGEERPEPDGDGDVWKAIGQLIVAIRAGARRQARVEAELVRLMGLAQVLWDALIRMGMSELQLHKMRRKVEAQVEGALAKAEAVVPDAGGAGNAKPEA